MTTSLIVRPTATRLEGLEPVSLTALEDGALVKIPLVGTVAAGLPIDMYEERNEVEVPASWVSKNTFALRVRGDSMIDDNIQDGDIVIVEQRVYADNGETVVARINGEQATLKRMYVEKDGIRLQPANSALEPIVLRHEDVEVLGIVKVVIRQS